MRIGILGCGGTGSYVVPNVLRLLQEKNIKSKLRLIDGDVVEARNIPRQNFCYADIGKNKAAVLAERYAEAFGIPIEVYCKRLVTETYANLFAEVELWIVCVDNNVTRRLMCNTSVRTRRVLDVGNELKYGQVFFHYGYFGTNIYDIHPEIRLDKEGSCAETPQQSYLINYMAANAVTIFLNHLIETHFYPNYFEILFNINGDISKRKIEDYSKYKKLAEKVLQKGGELTNG